VVVVVAKEARGVEEIFVGGSVEQVNDRIATGDRAGIFRWEQDVKRTVFL